MYSLTSMTLNDRFNKFLKTYFIFNSWCLYREFLVKKNYTDKIINKFTIIPLVDFLIIWIRLIFFCYTSVKSFKREKKSELG